MTQTASAPPSGDAFQELAAALTAETKPEKPAKSG